MTGTLAHGGIMTTERGLPPQGFRPGRGGRLLCSWPASFEGYFEDTSRPLAAGGHLDAEAIAAVARGLVHAVRRARR